MTQLYCKTKICFHKNKWNEQWHTKKATCCCHWLKALKIGLFFIIKDLCMNCKCVFSSVHLIFTNLILTTSDQVGNLCTRRLWCFHTCTARLKTSWSFHGELWLNLSLSPVVDVPCEVMVSFCVSTVRNILENSPWACRRHGGGDMRSANDLFH